MKEIKKTKKKLRVHPVMNRKFCPEKLGTILKQLKSQQQSLLPF